MTLYLDIRRDEVRLAAVDAKSAKWLRVAGDNVIAKALEKAKRVFGMTRKKPGAVVVAMSAADADRNVSWSGVRQGVSTANSLAFAWSVPVASIALRGDEEKSVIETAVRKAAKAAKKGKWISAVYDGEPNITVAKKVL